MSNKLYRRFRTSFKVGADERVRMSIFQRNVFVRKIMIRRRELPKKVIRGSARRDAENCPLSPLPKDLNLTAGATNFVKTLAQ